MPAWTIESLRRTTVDYFKQLGISTAQLDTQLLLAHYLGLSRVQLFMEFERPLTPKEVDGIRALVKRRAKAEPVAYIIGHKSFYDLELDVGPGVLIPRPETELLVDKALELLKEEESTLLLDICTGSGCIPLAILNSLQTVRAIGVDISPEALAYAKQNAKKLELDKRLGFVKGDFFAPVPARFQGQASLITSNPPYLTAQEMDDLMADVRHEPALALDGGPDGFDFYDRLANSAGQWLKPGGHLLAEMGWKQGPGMVQRFKAQGWSECVVHKDLAGHPRLFQATWPAQN